MWTDNFLPELSFACQLGLGEDTHVDDIGTPKTIHFTFGPGRELRTLHAYDTLVAMKNGAVFPTLLSQHLCHTLLKPLHKVPAEGISKRSVRNDGSAFKERRGAHALGAIDYLCGNNNVARANFLTQRADGRESKNDFNSKMFQCRNVRTGGYSGRRDGMPNTVTGNESDQCPIRKRTDGDGRAR